MIYKNKNLSGFTLVEILVGILIFSMVMVGGFQALSAIGIGKIRLIQKTDIEKESFYFTEKLFEMIKKGGTLDYEEYFNRKVVGTDYMSGHYDKETGFGNFGVSGIIGTTNYGSNFYYCRSGDGTNMGTSGCYDNGFHNSGLSPNLEPQRYGEYSLQFIDYNSNYDSDSGTPGDEDLNGNIRGDDDDEYLGLGPSAFDSGTDVKEVYLISGDKKTRTLFRWNVTLDPERPPISTCSGTKNPTGTGCLGTIQYLKLEGKDWGYDHEESTSDSGEYDGVIDTWIINEDFTGGDKNNTSDDIIAGSNSNSYRVNLFPDTINVKDFKVFAYPNTDINLAWKDSNPEINLSPYIRLQFSLTSSWKTRKQMRGNFPEMKFSTTINLTDIYSK